MNPQQVLDVYKLIRESRASPKEKVEAFRLLQELRRIAYAFLPNQRDQAMKLVLEEQPFEEVRHMIMHRKYRDWYAVLFMPFGSDDAYKKDNNGQTKAGLSQPIDEQALNVDVWAQFILHHWRPGGDNPISGTAMNRAYHVNRRSIFGYLLARALAPRVPGGSGTVPKTHFVRQYTLLVARPQAYREFIMQWEHETGEEFIPVKTKPSNIVLKRIPVEQCSANTTQDDVAHLLIENKIPPTWIDHAYTFGLYYIDHHLRIDSMINNIYIEADDERLRRLAEHGLPPPIRAWDRWYIPSKEDKIRICYIIMDETDHKHIYSLESDEWLFVREEVHPTYLRIHSAERAAHLYDTERTRIDALRHAEQTVGDNSHNSQVVPEATNIVQGTTNIAPGTTEGDVRMSETMEDDPSNAGPSGSAQPEEAPSGTEGAPIRTLSDEEM
ncbi:hypothetical protein BD779DRAFT_1670383 [Infundibulicybe gibba]|nr:hypothetical protein BD779DRAFT_1670383 [Infundibulicybe gibba]